MTNKYKVIALFMSILSLFYSFRSLNAQRIIELQKQINLQKLPRFSQNCIYIKLKKSVKADISYKQTEGFSKNYENESLFKVLKKYDISSIQKAFKTKSEELREIYRINFDNKSNGKLDKLIEMLKQTGLFDYVEKLPLHYPVLIPNDYYNFSNGVHINIGSPQAWDLTTGNSNVAIAVIDDGFLLNHEDLVNKIYSGSTDIPANNIDDDNNGFVDDYQGWDVADSDNNPNLPLSSQIYFTHGTPNAGIIAAQTNNGIGISSVGFNCTYIPVKIKEDASTSSALSNTYEGLDYAINTDAAIICMPWASLDSSQTFQLLCNTAYNNGKVLVAAAGNSGSNICLYPASYDHVISVGSCNSNDMISAFSTYNEKLDVVAPGVNIYSCSSSGINQYEVVQGTSISASITAGILGLMKAKNPAMTVDELETCLKNGAENINLMNPLKVGLIGSGKVNALGAITCAENPPIGKCNGTFKIRTCPGAVCNLNATSLGLNANTWEWILPGATPSNVFGQSVNVVYQYPGEYDIILIGCNSFGCDTSIFVNKVKVALPKATLINDSGNIFCLGSYLFLKVQLEGNPPFTIKYTDGSQIYTVNNIMSTLYSLPVSPVNTTTYSLTYMSDVQCAGSVSGSVTVNPTDCGPCSNTGFDFGNFATWKGETGKCCGIGNFIQDLSPDRHTIVSGNQTDPYSGGLVPMVCPLWNNNNFSARLGNWFVGGQAEKLSKKFLVTNENSNFTFAYAVFLEDPINHTQQDKPKFEFNILDSSGVQIPDSCAHFDVTAGPQTNLWHHNALLRFTDWQMVGVDLSQYIGHPVTVQFSTEDCGLLGHFGYSYIDATCGPSTILLNNLCDTNSVVTLSAPLGYTHYYWVPSGDTTQSVNITGLHESDTIWVHMTNVMGCSSSIKHIVNIVPKPIATATGDTTICLQGSAVLSGNGAGPGGSYIWTSIPVGFSATGQNISVSPTQTTTYQLKVINANGCEADSMPKVTVNVLNNSYFDLGQDIILCKDDSITLSSPVSGQINWSSYPPGFSSSDSSITVSADLNGKYYILNYQNGICSFRDSVKVSLFNYQYLNPITQVNYCSGQTSVQLSAPANYTSYLWIPGGDTTSSITVNTVPYQVYKAAMISSQGCFDTIVFMLKPIPDPIAFAGNDTSVCKGLGVGLSASGSLSPSASYHWTSIPSGFTSNAQSIIVFPQQNTQYVVAVSNGPNCPSPTTYDTVLVSVFTTPVFSLGPDLSICKGDTICLHVYIPGTFNSWSSNPPGFFSTDTSIYISPNSTTNYYLSVIDSICSSIDDINIVVKSGHLVNQIFTETYCPYDSIVSLSAPSGYTSYKWLHSGDTTQTIQIINPPYDSTFVILGKNPISNCSDTLYLNLKRADSVVVDLIVSDTVICKGNTVSLSVTGNSLYSYQWYSDNSGQLSATNILTDTPNDTTIYYIKITKSNCIYTDSVKISVIDIPDFNLGNDTSLCYGNSLVLNPNIHYVNYLWDDGSTDTLRNVTKTGTYTLNLSLGNCSKMDEIYIEIQSSEDSTLIPNIITPNGDGFNDKLCIKKIRINDFSLDIFNRWGQKVFETNDPYFKWDTSFNGGYLSDGTYFYIAKYYSVCQNKKIDEKGSITILR